MILNIPNISKGGKVIEIYVPQCDLFYLPRCMYHLSSAPSCSIICSHRDYPLVSPITLLPAPSIHTAAELAESKSEHIPLCLKSLREGGLGGSVTWATDSWFQLWSCDLRVPGLSPVSGSVLSRKSARDSLPLSPSALPPIAFSLSEINKALKKNLIGQPGWLSGLVLLSAQGLILETRDGVPRQAPCMEPASPSAWCLCLSLNLGLSWINKYNLKKKEKKDAWLLGMPIHR